MPITFCVPFREECLGQLTGYLKTLGLNEGWLILFDRDSEKDWDLKITWDEVARKGRTIHVVGC